MNISKLKCHEEVGHLQSEVRSSYKVLGSSPEVSHVFLLAVTSQYFHLSWDIVSPGMWLGALTGLIINEVMLSIFFCGENFVSGSSVPLIG